MFIFDATEMAMLDNRNYRNSSRQKNSNNK